MLARLDRRRRAHARIAELFDRCRQGDLMLHLSVVNLAEVLQHGRPYADATGLDLITLLSAFRVQLHRPDATVARRAAELASLEDASLGDRFAIATAEVLGARLYTTDTTLAAMRSRLRVSLTRF